MLLVLTQAEVERRPWLLRDADPLTELLFVQHGVLTTGQALARLSRSALRHRLRRGDLRTVHKGVYCAAAAAATPEQRRWIGVLAAGPKALLAGRTALAELGLKGFETPAVHVLLPAPRRLDRQPDGVIAHRTGVLPASHLGRPVPPCTSAERAVVDAASWARSDNEAATVLAMAFQQRLVTLPAIESVLSDLPRAKRRGFVRLHARLASGGAHSLAELKLLALLRQAGLPTPTLQKERIDADGRRRYLDLYFEEWRLHVEVDGAHHLEVRQAWADAHRQNRLFIVGDRLLRFPAWLVLERPNDVIAQIRAALVAAGWRPAQ